MTSTRILASGAVAVLDAKGLVIEIAPKCPICSGIGHDADDCYAYEGPHCSLCDALGHGYPGGGPCPLEERGWEDAEADRRYEAARGII